MRAFDVLTKVEFEIRGSAYPRYHLEMALLRWIHLRKLVPISDLIQGLESSPSPSVARTKPAAPVGQPSPVSRPSAPPPRAASTPAAEAPQPRPVPPLPRPPSTAAAMVKAVEARAEAKVAPPPSNGDAMPNVQRVGPGELKEAFLTELR